jgi:hypothetical protein
MPAPTNMTSAMIIALVESQKGDTPNERPVSSNGTIWLVPDKSVRQFHHADFGAAAKLNLGVVADPFHLRNKQHVYVNVARFTTAREKRRKYPTFHLTIL